ncbi:MAG: S24/S26 family peptidase [Clostridiaceae bacterium]|nr:S24/S26 family peptidase [Clostridiaceae bacterium]MDY5889272.1 S24/S26 family peptidase [Oscillospiraceae bacterium]
MSEKISLNEMAPLIRETLEKNGEVTFISAGRSMLPVIRDRKDAVTLVKPKREIKPGDIVFYQRDNGQFILHRVMFVNSDKYVMRGDNQWDNEYNIRRDQIIGVLKCFERNGKIHNVTDRDYLIYVKLLPLIRFFRKTYYGFKSKVYKFVKYLVKR